jgi:hypothetical protein
MIKLQIEDATLQTLDKALLPHVQWKSIRIGDLEGVDAEILNTYLFKMAKPVIKSLIKNKRAVPSNLSTEQWLELLQISQYEDWDLLSAVQMPYRVIREILDNEYNRRNYGRAIASTQDSVPVVEALGLMNYHDLNNILCTNSNPAIKHFIFTDEGIAIMKKRHDVVRSLRYLTTEEFQKLGRTFKNRTINPRVLNRAGACDSGQNYCREVLRELGRTSITWDEAIQEIRSNPTLRKRNSLMSYMDWIYDRSQYMEEV